MGPRCLFQKSVVGVKGNNICGVSWLRTQHTLGTLPMCIQYSLQTLFHSHLPPLEVLYASVRDQQAPSKYFQKQAAYNFPKHSVLEVGRPHLPGIIVCPDDTRYGEDRRRRHRPSQGGDSSALETRSVQRRIQELSKIHHLQEQEWEAVEAWQALCSYLSFDSLHPKKELS